MKHIIGEKICIELTILCFETGKRNFYHRFFLLGMEIPGLRAWLIRFQ